jgi:hypothetical protein
MKHGFKKQDACLSRDLFQERRSPDVPHRFPAFPYPCFIRVDPWLKIRRAAPRQEQIHAKEISATDGHG